MKIIAAREKSKYIEVLPSISISWYGGKTIYLGWLFWHIFIDF